MLWWICFIEQRIIYLTGSTDSFMIEIRCCLHAESRVPVSRSARFDSKSFCYEMCLTCCFCRSLLVHLENGYFGRGFDQMCPHLQHYNTYVDNIYNGSRVLGVGTQYFHVAITPLHQQRESYTGPISWCPVTQYSNYTLDTMWVSSP